jgi:hypothetical protein
MKNRIRTMIDEVDNLEAIYDIRNLISLLEAG